MFRRRRGTATGRLIGGALFTLFACAAIIAGVGMVLDQTYKLTTYVPVPATVEHAEVRLMSPGRSGRKPRAAQWAPAIAFRYIVDGMPYVSHTPLMVAEAKGASREWAQAIVERFPPGEPTTAWVDPRDPSDAFLVREPQAFPYRLVLFALLFLSIGLATIVGQRQEPSGAYSLSAPLVAWWVISGAAFAHWTWIGGAWDTSWVIHAAIHAGVGIALLVAWRVRPLVLSPLTARR